jgi:hypothetical protein
VVDDLATTFIAVLFFHFEQFSLDDLQDFFSSDKIPSSFAISFLSSASSFSISWRCKTSQTTELHRKDSCCLDLAEFESLHQVLLSFFRSLSGTDHLDYFVDVIKCNLETFEDMSTFLCLTSSNSVRRRTTI